MVTLSNTADKLMLIGLDDVNDLFAKTYDGTSWTDTEGGSALNANISNLAGLAFSADRKSGSIGTSADLQQIHYRWRNDDGGEIGGTIPAFCIQRGSSVVYAP